MTIARAFDDLGAKQTRELRVPDEKPSPYDGFLRSLEVGPDDSRLLVMIARESDRLCITGPTAHIRTLLREIESLVYRSRVTRSERESKHIHLEYYEGHPWLERESEPLIVEVEEN